MGETPMPRNVERFRSEKLQWLSVGGWKCKKRAK